MSTDRELLELAAKAAGIPIGEWDETDSAFYWFDRPGGCLWNPLTDDGDALRLAVKLCINIEHMETMGRVTHGVNCWPRGRGDCAATEPPGEDYRAATRRAIVRAAAEIGRAMP